MSRPLHPPPPGAPRVTDLFISALRVNLPRLRRGSTTRNRPMTPTLSHRRAFCRPLCPPGPRSPESRRAALRRWAKSAACDYSSSTTESSANLSQAHRRCPHSAAQIFNGSKTTVPFLLAQQTPKTEGEGILDRKLKNDGRDEDPRGR